MGSMRKAQDFASGGNLDEAVREYKRLLESVSGNDYETAAVAHMYAVIVDDPAEKLAINEEALRSAERCDRFPPQLFASLYGNIGYSKIQLGDRDAAKGWYEKAAVAADGLDDDDYGRMVREGIAGQLRSLRD